MIRRRVVAAILVFVLFLAPLAYPAPSTAEGDKTYLFSSKVTYINSGTIPTTLSPDDLLTNIFPNTSRQTTQLIAADSSEGLITDPDSNPCLLYSSKTIPAFKNLTLNLSMKILQRTTIPLRISFEGSGSLKDIPDGFERYLGTGGSTWQSDDHRIQALAQNISANLGNTRNILRIAAAAADWVGQHINPVSHDQTYSPTETYEAKEGDCDDQALLLIALLRSLGIPSYLQVGAAWTGQSESTSYWDNRMTSILVNVAYHGWAMVYIPPWRWLPFDMTLGWRSTDSLAVIRDAPVWRSRILVIMNASTMDWVRDGKEFKEWLKSKNLQIVAEDRLQMVLSPVEKLQEISPWLLMLALPSVSLFVLHDLRRRIGVS